MAKRDASPRLGRGLAALLGDAAVQAKPQGGPAVRQIPLDLLEPNPFQPRTVMDQGALAELTQSVRAHGILQPLLIRPHPDATERFQIVAGERRWRAAGSAGLHEVPALVQAMSDSEAAAIALIENLQRQDLNAIDEAEGYDRLLTQFGLTQEALGEAVGKSRSHIANTLRLLNLPASVKEAVRKGAISAGHARALLALPAPDAALREVIGKQLSVRQTEALANRPSRPPPQPGDDTSRGPSADAKALEAMLIQQLGLTTRVAFDGQGGSVQFFYTDLEQLDELLRRLGVQQ
ncbi:MAG TPA: ParB/RepB/Spo0J family partition protein [Acetobacteraceae bacterium]|nr:ParB/RepB/Spo0J family partition protein [Acetobacteraceae bacterium]